MKKNHLYTTISLSGVSWVQCFTSNRMGVKNWHGVSCKILAARPSPSLSGGGCRTLWNLSWRQVMRTGCSAARGGITMRSWVDLWMTYYIYFIAIIVSIVPIFWNVVWSLRINSKRIHWFLLEPIRLIKLLTLWLPFNPDFENLLYGIITCLLSWEGGGEYFYLLQWI